MTSTKSDKSKSNSIHTSSGLDNLPAQACATAHKSYPDSPHSLGRKSMASSTHPGPSVRSGNKDEEEEEEEEEFGGNREPFDTFRPKVIELCHAIGFGEPDEVERMEGGSFNKVIGLAFSAPKRRCILRIPLFPYLDSELWKHEISDQVSILLYLSQFEYLKVPQVLAYDTTTANVLKIQYSILNRLPGVNMQDVFYTLTLSEKIHLTKLVAEMAIKMTKIKLDRPGRLIGKRDLPDVSHAPLAHLHTIEIAGLREYGAQHVPPPMASEPFSESMVNVFEFKKKEDEEQGSLCLEMLRRLQKVTNEMAEAGLMRRHDQDTVLWHWDFAARNILIEEKEVVLNDVPQNVQDQESDPVSSIESASQGKGCHHSIQMDVRDESLNGHKHSVRVTIDEPGTACKHTVGVVIDDNHSRQYRSQVDFTGDEATTKVTSRLDTEIDGQAAKEADSQQHTTHLVDKKTTKQWVISGIIDWDDALSVPAVIARRPHSWLWADENDRSSKFKGNLDKAPERDLTQDELLIKAVYDQTMTKEYEHFLDDAYCRGVWLRRLFELAKEGFCDSAQWKQYDELILDWQEYYDSLGLPGTERKDSEDESSGEESLVESEDADEVSSEGNNGETDENSEVGLEEDGTATDSGCGMGED